MYSYELEQFLNSIISTALQNRTLFAYLLVAGGGLVTSLGPCTYSRLLALLGLVGTDTRVDKRKGFMLALYFILGTTAIYALFGSVSSLVGGGIEYSEVTYYIAAGISVIMGIHLIGIIRFRLPHSHGSKKPNWLKSKGLPFTSFTLGGLHGFMICPCCTPIVFTIIAFVAAKGDVLYGSTLLATYSLAHGIPLLIIGTYTGAARKFAQRMEFWAQYMELLAGTILVLVGIFYFWLA